MLKGLHERWVILLESMPDSAWNRTATHPDLGDVTLDDLLTSFAQHGETHLDFLPLPHRFSSFLPSVTQETRLTCGDGSLWRPAPNGGESDHCRQEGRRTAEPEGGGRAKAFP
jgi:hypothetical protein